MKGLIMRRDRLLWAIWFTIHDRLLDLLPVAKQRMLDEWQKTYNDSVSSIISGHCGVRAHLKRFSIVDGSMCVCLEVLQ
jgi:hypothetical protein